MSKFGVHVATWNVGDTKPPKDLSALVGLPESEYVIDILAVGLQEIPWSVLSTSPDPLSRTNPWLSHLTSILGKSEFVLVTATQMCGLQLALFVQRGVLPFLTSVESAQTPTGFFGLIGTKGVVSIRFQLHGTWFCFINAHFAAHSWNELVRVWEYDTILDYHCYEDQSKILDHDYVFWFGDLNFRIVNVPRQVVNQELEVENYSSLFAKDQLVQLQKKGILFSDFEETAMIFPPTYKKFKNGDYKSYVDCPKRLPSWCDRILYSSAPAPYSIQVLDYADIHQLNQSDHVPVYLQANVNIPKPAQNSFVCFGPATTHDLLSTDSNIMLMCNFTFWSNFKLDTSDFIALYPKFFARLDDHMIKWPVGDFLPLNSMRVDLTTEMEGKPLPAGFYCLLYHHKGRVAGVSDYFAIGEVSSDDDDFDEDLMGYDQSDEEDEIEVSYNLTGKKTNNNLNLSFPLQVARTSSSALRCKSARPGGRVPPRPKSARGNYDDISLTPGAASGESTSDRNSTSISPTSMLTPNQPPGALINHESSTANQNYEYDEDFEIEDDDDLDDSNDLIDDETF